MTSSRRFQIAACLLGCAGLGAALVGLQRLRERRFAGAEPAAQVLYVSSPAVVTRLALSYDSLVSDVYWIRAIQHYGRTRLERRASARYDLLFPLLDLTTSLDPRFAIAYRFGAFFLSERAPGGADRPDLAIRLLEKAMAANPDRWEYPHDIGFVYYRRGDYPRAADWFQRASEVPGATNWLGPLAAVTLATGGDARSARLLWQNILETSDESWIHRTAEHRLQQLDAIDQIRALERLVADYERRHGDPPPTWEDMVRDGALGRVPVDPAGTVYLLNPWWGSVTVSEESALWPLPLDHPR